jgi:hypothetical protein
VIAASAAARDCPGSRCALAIGRSPALDEVELPSRPNAAGGVGLVPNAAQSWTGVRDAIPRTYRRSVGVSDRSTEASVGALERTDREWESSA